MAEKRLPGLFETLGYNLPWADRALAATFDYAPQPGETTPYQSMLSNLQQKNYSGALVDALGVVGGPGGSLTGASRATFLPARMLKYPEGLIDRAKQLGKKAEAGSDFHAEHGIFVAPDGNVLGELSDEGMRLTGVRPSNTKTVTFGDMVDHPRLFEVAPELRNTKMAWLQRQEDIDRGVRGGYTVATNRARFSPKLSDEQLRSSVMHEVAGHAAQAQYGLDLGANDTIIRAAVQAGPDYKLLEQVFSPEELDNILKYTSETRYLDKQGEQLARGIQDRLDWTQAHRGLIPYEFSPRARTWFGQQIPTDVTFRPLPREGIFKK